MFSSGELPVCSFLSSGRRRSNVRSGTWAADVRRDGLQIPRPAQAATSAKHADPRTGFRRMDTGLLQRDRFGFPADRALAALEPRAEGRSNRPGRSRTLRRAPRRMKQQRICKQHRRDRNPAPGRQPRIRGYQRRHAINQGRKGTLDIVGDKLLRLPPQGFALPRYLPRNDAKPISRLDERVFCHCTAAIVCMPKRWRRYQGTGLP